MLARVWSRRLGATVGVGLVGLLLVLCLVVGQMSANVQAKRPRKVDSSAPDQEYAMACDSVCGAMKEIDSFKECCHLIGKDKSKVPWEKVIIKSRRAGKRANRKVDPDAPDNEYVIACDSGCGALDELMAFKDCCHLLSKDKKKVPWEKVVIHNRAADIAASLALRDNIFENVANCVRDIALNFIANNIKIPSACCELPLVSFLCGDDRADVAKTARGGRAGKIRHHGKDEM